MVSDLTCSIEFISFKISSSFIIVPISCYLSFSVFNGMILDKTYHLIKYFVPAVSYGPVPKAKFSRYDRLFLYLIHISLA